MEISHGMKKFLLTVGLIVILFGVGYLLTKNYMFAGLIAILGTVILK